MTNDEILTILQADLGELYPNEERAAFLQNSIDAARGFIAREGIVLTDSLEDGRLVELYAAYLVRKRAAAEPMPRMLRWALNNRVFGKKGGGGGDA